ncbi:MAG: hypothetical protein WCO19_02540, partial [Candidatus Saccharibacteria bacterium]
MKQSNQESPAAVRPTKKQREILTYIQNFIAEHGYSPSYREIMKGLNYTSVATISLHVNSLISRGHLRKRDHSARSIEVVNNVEIKPITTNQVTASQEKWLVKRIEGMFKAAEQVAKPSEQQMDELYVVVGALRVLELEGAAQSFI